MGTNTSKPKTELDSGQTLQFAFNENERSLSVGSFITGKINHKIVKANTTSTIEQYSYFDNLTLLFIVEVEYVDSTKNDLLRVERIS